MIRAAALACVALAAAGCGSSATSSKHAPQPPRLPRTLAHTWAQQANAVASSLAAGDGCAAQAQVAQLRQEVVDAVNAHRVPQRLLEPLASGVNDLATRVTCTPPAVQQPVGDGPGHGHGRGKAKGHHKHGEGGD